MKYFKLDLLTLLISLFIFSSCEKEGTIGLDIGAADSIKSVFTESSIVRAVTVEEDSVVTSGLTQNPFGWMVDPVFGTTEANLALGLSLPSNNFSFGTSPALDSAVLVLKYGDEFFGDSLNSKYVIDVHQLSASTPLAPKTYSSKSVFQKESTIIGGENVQNVRSFRWNDSAFVTSIIKGAPDKVVKVAPQLRIRLTRDFIEQNFFAAGATSLKNDAAFAQHIKGLYLTINKNMSTPPGGLIFFDLGSQISALEIYYKNGTTTDTSVARFKVVGASEIRRDRANTPVAAQLNAPQTASPVVYVQPLGGVRTKLEFTDLNKLAEKGNIAVNKAELVIPVVQGTDPFRPAQRLTLYRTDIAGQRVIIPDNASGENFFGGFYNASAKTYTFNITSYVQGLISNPPNYETAMYIAPVDQTLSGRPNFFPSATTAARSILGGGTGASPTPIKLKITYTKPN